MGAVASLSYPLLVAITDAKEPRGDTQLANDPFSDHLDSATNAVQPPAASPAAPVAGMTPEPDTRRAQLNSDAGVRNHSKVRQRPGNRHRQRR